MAGADFHPTQSIDRPTSPLWSGFGHEQSVRAVNGHPACVTPRFTAEAFFVLFLDPLVIMVEVDVTAVAGVAATALAAYVIHGASSQDRSATPSPRALKGWSRAWPVCPVGPQRRHGGERQDGPVLRVGPIVLQRAQFGALWVRIGRACLWPPLAYFAM